MLDNKEVSEKLKEISDKINQTVKSYADGDIIVEKFVNDLWALHYKLNNVSYENAQIIQQDPKLLRISRTLFQEIFKYINQHLQAKPENDDKQNDDQIYF